MKKQLKVIELFAGIGAPRKALIRGRYNFKIVDAIEIDKYAVKSYNAIYNTNIETKDVCKYKPDKTDIGEIDLLFHGSPCQDFSLAGKQAGGDKDSGTRSSLMYETIRIVEKLKPKYVIWENVKNLISKKHRHNFDAYLETMESLGYTNYYQVLNAKDYGIPQNRERVFTVSILGNESYEFPKGKENNNKIDRIFNFSARQDCRVVYDENGLCPTLVAGMGQGGGKVPMFIEKPFVFPPKQELKLKLKDMLEDEVDEKYYLTSSMINYLENGKYQSSKVSNKLKQTETGICPTLDTMQGGNRQPFIKSKCKRLDSLVEKTEFEEGKVLNMDLYNQTTNENISQCLTEPHHNSQRLFDGLRIRKLTPKEAWRLMGFDDEDFEKAAFKKETSYIEGGSKCNAKLKIVNEKQRHLDMETYALCTTNDMLDMETPIRTKRKKSIENENNEKMQNVNIAIEMLGGVEQKECATNIIKCGENTTILYTLMGELDQHHMAIIELEKRGKASIEKYMKITLEENLNPMKLYTISTLIEQIIKSKIYTCIVQKANIQGNIAIIEDCVKNLKMMKLLNLKMEYTTRLNSDTMLYKQAGNSIVVNVLEAIFDNLLQEYK